MRSKLSPAIFAIPIAVRQVVAGCKTVLHLAALISIPYSYLAPESYVDTNVTGTLNVVQAAAMAVRSFEVQVPYGVVDISDNEILGLRGKPVSKHFINASIYVQGHAALDLVPQNQAFNMPQLSTPAARTTCGPWPIRLRNTGSISDKWTTIVAPMPILRPFSKAASGAVRPQAPRPARFP